MRIWDIDPGFLNDRSLLGEHRELHGIFSILVNHKTGYSRHPETLRWQGHLPALAVRHGLLVAEMSLRGFHHHSPLPPPSGTIVWPERDIDPPGQQYAILTEKYRTKNQGRILLPKDHQQLWASHKYSVLARSPETYRRIGPLVATGTLTLANLAGELLELLRTPPTPGRLHNSLQHLWGYVSSFSDLRLDSANPATLLKEIGRLAREQQIAYLLQSTALGELRFWCEFLSNPLA
ncbi:MAG: DUF1722 domain-containing protein [Desulfobulbaceae bacterium]|nr:DUF1722 domain-containing protein [Desulfobulbaceae bacterium]